MAISDKRTHILEKAEELFAQQGYEGTTVRDIAKAAGVNLAMISYYFGSKEKLMEALFGERMLLVKIRVGNILTDKKIPLFEKMEIMIDEYIDRVIKKECFYRIMQTEQMINKNLMILKQLKELKIGYANMISELIKEGQKAKKFRKNVDVVMLLTTMTGTVTQMIINKEYYREFNQLGKIPDAEFETILKTRLSQHIKELFKATLGYEA